MNKYSVDYNFLDDSLKEKPKVFKYADVKDRLVKVAFDVVRFVDGDDLSGLWMVSQTDDGEYIVAQYDDSYSDTEKTASGWNAYADSSNDNVHIFYKNDPVTKISTASLGIDKDETYLAVDVLSEKLSSNSNLVEGLLAELPAEKRKELLDNHPELKD